MSRRELTLAVALTALVVGLTVASAPVAAQVCGPDLDGRVATPVYGDTTISWEPIVDYVRVVLTIAGPCEDIVKVFRRGEQIYFDLREIERVQDGDYRWELRREAPIAAATKKSLAEARASGDDSIWWSLWQKGAIPEGPYVDSEPFSVNQGIIVPPGGEEGFTESIAAAAAGRSSAPGSSAVSGSAVRRRDGASAAAESLRPIVEADQVIPDDLIVQGSACVGFDCVNNESFSFDTIRLKENNLRIKFEDTSTTAGYPSNDWQLTANDSASGGAAKFSIEDITGAKVPFTVRAGAATNSIFVDSTGRVGFRTSTPVLDLHVSTSNTPAMRLEQTNAGGFTAQTWDIAGNEANFFVRDVTGGSRLPFRIRPGAPTSSVDISADGDVGVGTASPDVKLHVLGSGGTTKFLVEETNGTQIDREVAEFRNNGNVAVGYENTAVTQRWANNVGTNFLLNEQINAGIEFTLTNTGNLTIAGTLTQNSDRTTKTDLSLVDPAAVLAKIDALPIMTWRKIGDQALHMGPMAQDFAAAFGLGEDDRHIATIDMAGASMAAIQALHQKLQERDAQIAELQKRLESEIAQLKELLERSANQR